LLCAVLILVSAGCDEKEKEQEVNVPKNLDFEVEIASDGSGDVTLTATAENVVYYSIFFGESSGETPIISEDGIESYTYTLSGSYTVKVQAHTGISAYIVKTKVITVALKGEYSYPQTGYTTPTTYPNMTMVWNDEFDGEAVNTNFWTF